MTCGKRPYGLFKSVRDFRADAGSTFSAFAELCITRQIVTAIKSAKRLKHQHRNNTVSTDAPLTFDKSPRTLLDITPSPAQPERDADLTQVVRDAIADAPLSDMEAEILLHYLKGGSYAETARRLGKSVKPVDNAMQRARKKTDHALREAVSAHLAATREAETLI